MNEQEGQTEEQQPQQEQQDFVQEEQQVSALPFSLNTKLIIGIAVGFVLVVVGIAGAYFLLQSNVQPVDDIFPPTFEDYESFIPPDDLSEEEFPPDILGEEILSVISPSKNDRLCLGEETVIEWSAPEDMEAIILLLDAIGGGSLPIGSYLASNSDSGILGEGLAIWTVGETQNRSNQDVLLVEEGIYRIVISGEYNNSYQSEKGDIFSIVDCRG